VIVSASYRQPTFRPFTRTGSCGGCAPAIAVSPIRYGGATYDVSLAPDAVDGSFCGPQHGALMPDLDAVRRVAPFIVQFTLTG